MGKPSISIEIRKENNGRFRPILHYDPVGNDTKEYSSDFTLMPGDVRDRDNAQAMYDNLREEYYGTYITFTSILNCKDALDLDDSSLTFVYLVLKGVPQKWEKEIDVPHDVMDEALAVGTMRLVAENLRFKERMPSIFQILERLR